MRNGYVVSLGYERRSIAELLALLTSHGVRKLVDVREAPVSRRPGFSKQALAAALAAVGIEYLHLRAAGNPHRKDGVDIMRCLALYRAHLAANREILDEVSAELDCDVVAVLCYERDHECCHRSVLLNALNQQGLDLEVVCVQ